MTWRLTCNTFAAHQGATARRLGIATLEQSTPKLALQGVLATKLQAF